MIVVAGMWELGWNTPIKEIDLWEMVIRDFGVDVFCMTPVSGIDSRWVKEYISLDEILKIHVALPVVIVDEKGEEKLNSFTHPESCLYVFGKTTCSPLHLRKPQHRTLCVETVANDALLWAHQVCAIVLYDRMVKSWH